MKRQLILAGAGDANLAMLRALARARHRHGALMVAPAVHHISPDALLAWIAGRRSDEACRVDLRQLADKAGVELIESAIGGVDATRRCLALADGRHIEFEALSLDIDGESDLSKFSACGPVLAPIRPVHGFVQHWRDIVATATARGRCRLAIVGEADQAAELALAAEQRLRPLGDVSISLVVRHGELLSDFDTRVLRQIERLIAARGIDLIYANAVGDSTGLLLDDGRLIHADRVIVTTRVTPPPWIALSGLTLDASGYVQVDSLQRSLTHPYVHVSGDISRDCVSARPNVGASRSRRAPQAVSNALLAVLNQQAPHGSLSHGLLSTFCARSTHMLARWCKLSFGGRHALRWPDTQGNGDAPSMDLPGVRDDA